MIVGFRNCSMFWCVLLHVNSSFAIILMGKRELVVLIFVFLVSRDCCVALFLTVPRVCLQFVIVVLPDHTQLLIFKCLVLKPQYFAHLWTINITCSCYK